ncbi:glycoside hydrolase family 2 TIM barrel-domain containing protein [Streptomyces sp. NBC_00624]|uniref:glycoside hydrolase family 2 protein n=1 Tax=Streptomyces sp. NBC_00624 TaxID=2975791 RepID=UPI0030DF99B0
MPRRRTFLIGSAALAAGVLGAGPGAATTAWAATGSAGQAAVTLTPLPESVDGVRDPVISLGGSWAVSVDPPGEFWKNDFDPAQWQRATVPGEPAMQDIEVPRDKEFAYKTRIEVPADFAGHRIVLRFDAVYSDARVWVDGTFVRDHRGGFTAWQADITELVTPGELAWLTVGVTDRWQDLSYGSYYARHQMGGILGDVRLVALPGQHLAGVHISTTFDRQFRDAVLGLELTAATSDPLPVQLWLRDPDGREVLRRSLTLDGTDHFDIDVSEPLKWDAEHPHLYTLDLRTGSGDRTSRVVRRIGFRQIQVDGKRLLVNGHPVKLRGVAHHSVSPTTGRGATARYDEQDVRLFKVANINLIRTSHYPPSEALLDAADRYGMYVEEETAVCWVNQQGHDDSLNDPAAKADWLGQLAEMVERDRNHPSVLLWSTANENIGWGDNPQAQWDYLKAVDPSRPIVYSHAETYSTGAKYDIFTAHYPDVKGELGGETAKASLYDEYAHLAAYDIDDLKNDPGVRNFWGETIARFWPKCHETEGVLGGAIWAGIDEVFELPGEVSGTAEWGLLDIWRREKPEYWLAKKAYSPIRIADRPLTGQKPRTPLTVPVANWYDSTNLSELTVRWKVGKAHGRLLGTDLGPGRSGTLSIPHRGWSEGDVLELEFVDAAGRTVDAYALPIGSVKAPSRPSPAGRAPSIEQTDDTIILSGSLFSIIFSRTTGLITEARHADAPVLTGGPFLHLRGGYLPSWQFAEIGAEPTGEHTATVTISGAYGDTPVTFAVSVDGTGLVSTTYTIGKALPDQPEGGYQELGVRFLVPEGVDRLAWHTDALWSVYPDDHIGRPVGSALATPDHAPHRYRSRPAWNWNEDTHDYFLYGTDDPGRDSNDFRALRSAVRTFALTRRDGTGVCVESDGTVAARVDRTPPQWIDDTDPAITYYGDWTHARGEDWTHNDYGDTESFTFTAGDWCELAFTGTGIEWIGGPGPNLGRIDVLIDGQLDATVDQYAPVKQYQQVSYRKTGLAVGRHTIRLVITGEKNPSSSNILPLVDAFHVLPEPAASRSVCIDTHWNYPDYGYGGGDYYRPAVRVDDDATGTASLRIGRFEAH